MIENREAKRPCVHRQKEGTVEQQGVLIIKGAKAIR